MHQCINTSKRNSSLYPKVVSKVISCLNQTIYLKNKELTAQT